MLRLERRPPDRRAVEKLRVGPDRCDGRDLVDGDVGRRRGAEHRQKGERRIVARALVDRRDAALRDEIEALARPGRCVDADRKAPVIRGFDLGELLGRIRARRPQGHGRVRNRAAARLNLPVDVNRGGRGAAQESEQAKGHCAAERRLSDCKLHLMLLSPRERVLILWAAITHLVFAGAQIWVIGGAARR